MTNERRPYFADDLCNCHAEGRRFESDQPLFATALHVSVGGCRGRTLRISVPCDREALRVSEEADALDGIVDDLF